MIGIEGLIRKEMLMVRLIRISMALCVLIVLAACGGATADTTGGATGASSGAASGAAPESTSGTGSSASGGAMPEASGHGSSGKGGTASPGNVVGSLTRSGGIAGRVQTVMVMDDGTVNLINGEANGAVFKTGKATDAQLQSLKATCAGNDWQQLQSSYGKQVPDGFAYTLECNGKQITTYDGAQNPPALEQVLSQMSQMFQVVQTGK